MFVGQVSPYDYDRISFILQNLTDRDQAVGLNVKQVYFVSICI